VTEQITYDDLQSEYVSFKSDLVFSDWILGYDSLLFILIILVIMTTLFDWLPEVF